jgi:hypothetical protein
MLFNPDESRQQQAAEAHASHERTEQHTERDGRGSDHELKELEPDDLVYERGAAAADEEQQQHRHEPARCHSGVPRRTAGENQDVT